MATMPPELTGELGSTITLENITEWDEWSEAAKLNQSAIERAI